MDEGKIPSLHHTSGPLQDVPLHSTARRKEQDRIFIELDGPDKFRFVKLPHATVPDFLPLLPSSRHHTGSLMMWIIQRIGKKGSPG
jgi:hypothetical protein